MLLKKVVVLLFFCAFGVHYLTAQSVELEQSLTLIEGTIPQEKTENWTYYIDKNQQVLFIDLGKWQGNLTDLKLKTTAGTILFEENLIDIPNNTIYELDLKTFTAENYILELRTFNGVIDKVVQLK